MHDIVSCDENGGWFRQESQHKRGIGDMLIFFMFASKFINLIWSSMEICSEGLQYSMDYSIIMEYKAHSYYVDANCCCMLILKFEMASDAVNRPVFALTFDFQRQKQYFEQRKRQQQHHIAGLESYTDGVSLLGQDNKEQRSLDVLSLLNLSSIAQECKTRSNGKFISLLILNLPRSYCQHISVYLPYIV